jgi:hypothetical protein
MSEQGLRKWKAYANEVSVLPGLRHSYAVPSHVIPAEAGIQD